MHGSLQNLMASSSTQAHAQTPEVGDGATIVLWTDRTPATVVEVVSRTHVRIQRDRAQYAWPSGIATLVERDPEGIIEDVRRGKDGRWAISGQRSVSVMLGVRSGYRDPSF